MTIAVTSGTGVGGNVSPDGVGETSGVFPGSGVTGYGVFVNGVNTGGGVDGVIVLSGDKVVPLHVNSVIMVT